MAYLHKKFKKLASVDTQQQENDRILSEKSPSPPAPTHQDASLKHSVGSMVSSGDHSTVISESSDNRNRNICPYCNVICPKPSVLEKHIRTHTNERPYPCESCKFSFKTKSNLYKHFKSRSHVLRVERGIESSGAEIIAELGDTAKEELDTVSPVRHGDLPPPAPLPHGQQPGVVLLPSHLVKPGIIPPQDLAAVSRLAAAGSYPPGYRLSHPGLRFLDPSSLPLINGHHLVPGAEHESFTLHHSPQHPQHPPQLVRHNEPGQHHPQPPPPVQYQHFPGLPQHPIREVRPHLYELTRDNSLPVETRESRDTRDNKKINAESLEQRINKVISENQAIVETLDPFWKGRYMRQSSREERRHSLTQQQPQPPPAVSQEDHHQQQHPSIPELQVRQSKPQPLTIANSLRDSVPGVQNLSTSVTGSNFISNNVPQPPRPDSNIPLNLSDSGRKRKSPENLMIDGSSVKEVWLNSQKKAGNISHLEDIASKIEAKIRNSENPFHPDNPEGSIIKDLLLKTRQGHLVIAGSDLAPVLQSDESPRRLSESSNPVNLQLSPTNKDQLNHIGGIPIPKNFLPATTKVSGEVGASLYQCNLCQVTFKSLESIEIHQNHYCKNTRHPSTEMLRPNSTVTHHPVTRDTRVEHVVRVSPSVGDRRKTEAGPGVGEPPVKRSRSDSYPTLHTAGPANITVTNMGLLQIAGSAVSSGAVRRDGLVMTTAGSGLVSTTISTIPGIPTPNLSGVLTGIKSQPLFSLPGVRPGADLETGACAVVKKPGEPDKPVTFVLGIPGPHSGHQTIVTKTAPVTAVAGVIPVPVEHTFLKPPVNMAPLTPVSINCLQSPAKLGSAPGQKLNFNSPQRKYEFSATTKVESPQRPLQSSGGSQDILKNISSPSRDNKPERPDSLALPPGALFKKKEVHLSGATLISPETPRPKKAYVLSYQNGTAYTFLGLKCSTRVFFCSIHKPQPNYVQLELNSKVSMYSNWKVVAKDSHPSGLTPQVGMSAYNTTNHSSIYGYYSTAAPKKSLMITTHSSRWHEKKSSLHSSMSSHTSVEDKKSHPTTEVCNH